MSKTFSFALIGLAGASTLLAATGASARRRGTTATKEPKPVVISTRKVPKLGTVLVDGNGRTLYMFVPDKHKRVTCKGRCAVIWPPVVRRPGARIETKGKAKASLIGTDRNPAGGRVVTYRHWPLYTYIADRAPGQAKGQALDLNGGLWYVLAPSGKVIRTKLHGSGSVSVPVTAAAIARGKTFARRYSCTGCHTVDGTASTGPTWKGLAGSKVRLIGGGTTRATDSYLVDVITDPGALQVAGYDPGVMQEAIPAGEVSDAQARAIVAFIKSLK